MSNFDEDAVFEVYADPPDVGPFTVYILELPQPNHLYVGQTTNVSHRLYAHIHRKGSRFTKRHGVAQFHLVDEVSTREQAIMIESDLTRELYNAGYCANRHHSQCRNK